MFPTFRVLLSSKTLNEKCTATNNTFCLFGFTALPPWTAVVLFLRCFAVRQNSKLKIGHGCPILSTSPAKCVNSRAPSQTEAKTVAPAVRTEVVPRAYSADVRVEEPTAAAFNTFSTRRGTLRIGNNTALLISIIA
ncbi:hypothetical protein HMPREF9729_00612 [Treponema denticola ASLM]|nr:hypothetical protein HMPREF9729_00612 [Treponema denticola ASLM]EMD55875.1 hypothetical protein HMPREF9728_02384 [Treponema denticola US-Trep]